AGLLLEGAEARHGEQEHADAEEQGPDDPERDPPTQLLQRDDRLLLEVGDDELPQLLDELRERGAAVLRRAGCRVAHGFFLITAAPPPRACPPSARAVRPAARPGTGRRSRRSGRASRCRLPGRSRRWR